MRKLVLLVFLAACRIDLPEYQSDDALADATVPDAEPSPDMMPPGDPAMLTTAQGPHDFGDATVDTTSGTLMVIVRNSGEEPTSALSASLTDDTHFDLLVAGTDDCVGIVLQPQATCVAEVRFAPTSAGPHEATLEVTATDGGTITVMLEGNGLTPGDLDITAGDALTFSTIEIQSMSATQTVTVQNTGGSATAALETILSDETNYTITADDCDGVMLGAGLSCDVDVRFDPTTVGALPASISVRESPTVGVAASATGTGTARLAVAKSGVGNVVSTPAGINCLGAAACTTTSFSQTPVQLTATATDVNYVFDDWGGLCDGELTTTCSVPLTTPLNAVEVTFRQLDCTPDTIVCDDGTDHYVDCGPTGDIEFEMDCPLGCASGVEKCVDVDPSNGLSDYLDVSPTGPDLSFAGVSTINTDTGAVVNGGTGVSVPTAVEGGVRVLMFNSLAISDTVKVSGTAPLALVVNGAVTIAGTLDISADGATAGPGFQTGACAGGAITANPAGGGGGAGRGQIGRAGGSSSTPTAGGTAGAEALNATGTPLTGGCAGGLARTSIAATSPRGAGGGGGGALQIVSRVSISLTGSGVIDASGGGGRGGYSAVAMLDGPGGGGGSGGGILLEAPQILMNGAGVTISTKGGGGGGVGQTAHGADGGTAAGAASGGSMGTKPVGGAGGTESVLGTTGGNANAASSGHGAGGGGASGEATFNTHLGSVVPQNGATIRSKRNDGALGTREVPES